MPVQRLAVILIAFPCVVLFAAGCSRPQRAPESAASAVVTLSQDQRSALASAAVRDPRVRSLIGSQTPEVASAEVFGDKAQGERVLAGQSNEPPKRLALMLLHNRSSNRAARVLIDMTSSNVIEVAPVVPAAVPLSREDIVEAFEIAKRDAGVRAFLGASIERFQVPESPGTKPYAVAGLHVRSSNRQDPCFTGRCVDLLFFAESGYLPRRVLVDLTNRSVRLEGGSR